MKKIILLITILICGNILFAKSDFTEEHKLATTAKVWGFLKYYHPDVANGKFNWDEELFKILPEIKNSRSKEELSEIYLKWINGLGDIETCTNCELKDGVEYFDKNFNLDWISDAGIFTQELSDKLKFIELNRHQGKKYYVSVARKKIGNVKITNEIEYNDFDWKNEDLRLLTLFRYWNIIEYFFPYKYQTDLNWDDVLSRMTPKFLYSKSEEDFHLAMLELVVNIDDSHADFATDLTNAFFGNYWIPAGFKLMDSTAIITRFYNKGFAELDDLKIGDVITKVDGLDVQTIFQKREKYINGSNLSRKKWKAFRSIFNGSTNAVEIDYIRDGTTAKKTLKRYSINDINYTWNGSTEKFKILDNNIGYVDMTQLKIKDVSKMMKSLKDTKAIIFDLRYGSDWTLHLISNYINSQEKDFFKAIYPDLSYPGKFIWRDGYICGKKGELKYKGNVVLLVGEISQSRTEFTAMCLQAGDNVTTIGSQTSGADGNVSRFEMVGNYKTMITGVGIFYPDKTETQRKGVKIDIVCKPTIDGIIAEKDEVLKRALDYINN